MLASPAECISERTLQVYDNSADVRPGQPIPDPALVLEMTQGRIVSPDPYDTEALAHTPAWAKQIVQAATELDATTVLVIDPQIPKCDA